MTAPRILVLGWIGSTNLGDELIAEDVCRLVRDAGGEPSVATVDPTASAHLGVPTVRHAGPGDAIPLARAVLSHDGVLFGGGGLVQDETGPLNLPFHLSRLATARLLRRPWAGVALGVGDVRRRAGRALVRAVMRGAVGVTVRDKASAARLASLTGRPPVVACDPVLARVPPAVPASDHLVVCLRRANEPGQRRLTTTDPPNQARVAAWAEIVDAVAARFELGVRFVAWEREQDHALHRAVAARLAAPAACETPGVDRVIERIGSGRLVLTMRYHGAVAALLHDRPAVVLDYSPKMRDLVEESQGGLALAPLDAAPDTIIGMAGEIETASSTRHDAVARLRVRGAANAEVVQRLTEAAARRS